MSSTIVHSLLTVGGIAIGISATLAFTSNNSTTTNSKKESNSNSNSNPLIRPSSNGVLPSRNGELSGGGVIQRQIGSLILSAMIFEKH